MSKIKVIGFDLDDTLWDNLPVMINAEKTLNQWLKENAPNLQYDTESLRSLRSDILRQDPSLGARLTELRWKVIHEATRVSGYSGKASADIADQGMSIFLTARNQVTFFDGAIECLERLAGDFILGSLSNGNSSIISLGLDGYFSFAFSAEDVGAAKPAPDLFFKALAHTGVNPDQMVYVGDNPILDVDAAKSVGLKTVWLNRQNKARGQTTPDATINDISELLQAITLINQDRGS